MKKSAQVLMIGTLVLYASCTVGQEETAEAPVPRPAGPSSADPSALAAADSCVLAMGGWEGWNQARYLTFDFVIEREGEELRRTTHQWDRFGGNCRVQGSNREGVHYDVVMNITSQEGTVLLEGEPADEESHASFLELAHGVFINDMYWLLMPFKLHDPGVHLTDEGARTDEDGNTWRVIHLRFDTGVGLTSEDQYWVYLDPETYRVHRWDFHLEGMEKEKPANVASWEGWQQYGPIWLSTEKRPPNSNIVLRFENVEVSSEVPEGVFG